MQRDTGQIYNGDLDTIAKKLLREKIDPLASELEKQEKLEEIKKKLIVLPFQVGDIVEVKGIKFKVEKIRQNPVNRVMLKGIPQDSN